ncbi:major facilitator superfamily domain-containing protein [Mucor mucedo]|uniref:major facilitator superfamily domain-containing protein n=1 Tax=Mucor mucedo TaxID=29922 RepID=UPI0022205CBC|nr:major facilitator superfamily domain-containing protein [Mucor mucedo]KAI7866950.1 major facilitator superfamily domain-containing protein [Mucor mucedo]
MTGSEAGQSKTDEVTPLLPRQRQGSWENDAKRTAKKPSVWYVIAPLFGLTLCFGGLYAPLIQFHTMIFCNRYYQSQSGDNEDIPFENCAIPEVQSIVSEAQAIIVFLTYASTLLVASYYGALSDRKGRRVVFLISGLGNISMAGAYIITMKYQHIFGVSLLFIAPVLRGILAGDTVVSAAVQSYISDCTTSTERTVAFGHMMSALFLGASIGPSVASIIIKQTGTIMSIFYIVLVISLIFELFVIFVMPESHDFENFQQPPKQQQNFFQRINVFSALHILIRTKSEHANRYALLIAASVIFLFTVIALPPTLLYAMLKFHWTAYEGGFMISISSASKLVVLLFLLPFIAKVFHKDRASAIKHAEEEEVEASTSQAVAVPSDADAIHAISFDIWMIRVGLSAEIITYIVYGLVTTSQGFTLTAMFHSFSALALPSLRSIITRLVSPSEIGELMGAMAILEACAMILSQLTINTLYSASVTIFPQLTFFVCAAVASIALVLACFVRAGPTKSLNISA